MTHNMKNDVFIINIELNKGFQMNKFFFFHFSGFNIVL